MRRRALLKAGAGALPLAAFASTDAFGAETTNQESYGPLDSVEIEGTAEAFVQQDRSVAYVAADDRLAVVDIADPENLAVIAERGDLEVSDDPASDETLQTIYDGWAWEDRVLLAGPGVEDPESAQGFVLFDVSDPSSPEVVAREQTGSNIHNCFIDDGMVYLTGSSLYNDTDRVPLVIYDVGDDDPTEVARWSPRDYNQEWSQVTINQRNLHDVYVQDGIAYLAYWDAGTWLLDVSDPQRIEVLDRVGDYGISDLVDLDRREAGVESLTPDGNSHFTTVNEDGTLLAVSREAWAVELPSGFEGGPDGVDLYDISDKTNVQHLARIDPPGSEYSLRETRSGKFTTAHNCEIVGDRLYTSWYHGGVKIHDISDPENPAELARWNDRENVSFWTAQAGEPGEFFVASSVNMEAFLGSQQDETRAGLYTFPNPNSAIGSGSDGDSDGGDASDGDGGSDGGDASDGDGASDGGDASDSDSGSDGGDASDGDGRDGSDGDGGSDGGDASERDSGSDGGDTSDGDGGSNGGDASDGDGASDGGDASDGDGGSESESDSQESTPAEDGEDDESGPGFGIGGALAAIGGASYVLKRRLTGDSADDIDD